MQAQLQEALEKLTGLPLTKTTRTELIQYFHFGKTHYTTPQGLVLDVGQLVLAVNCPWELHMNSGERIKHNEVFMRKRETGLPSTKFDWKIPGENLRDQRLKDMVIQGPALTVAALEVQDNYGFILQFTADARLIVSPDTTKEQEMHWQLFSNTGDDFSITAGSSEIV